MKERGSSLPAGTAATPGAVDLSIVICTFDRHQLLAKAVRSCLEQESSTGLVYEVVIVDNSVDANARDLVRAFGQSSQKLVRYLSDPRINIAHARNTGVAASRGRFVAFMDDDMTAPPDWIESAVATIEQTGADVLFGKVVPVFEDGSAPALPEAGRWFTRAFDVADGGAVRIDPSGHVRHGRTSNCVLRRATTILGGAPFDPAFGRTGGEDTDFLQRLGQRGAVMVFSERAWMNEFVPANRSTPAYVARREFRGSQNFVRSVVKNSRRKWLTACRHLATGIAQLGLALATYGLARATGKNALPARVAVAAALGKVFWMRRQTTAPYR